MGDVRKWGTTPAEKALCERNSRELLAVWARSDAIADYANRQWNVLPPGFHEQQSDFELFHHTIKEA